MITSKVFNNKMTKIAQFLRRKKRKNEMGVIVLLKDNSKGNLTRNSNMSKSSNTSRLKKKRKSETDVSNISLNSPLKD